MSLSRDLTLAVLAMDVYHREHEIALRKTNGELPTALGLSNFVQGSLGLNGVATELGFYGGHYTTAFEDVISYRGTNELVNDVFYGWSIGGGNILSDYSQLDSTLNFFEIITGSNWQEGAANGFAVTGHSLGGGLAGLAASLSGTSGIGFDNMPFGIAANLTYLYDLSENWLPYLQNAGVGSTFWDTIAFVGDIAQFVSDFEGSFVDFDSFEEIWTEGEILQFLRDGTIQTTGASAAALASLLTLPFDYALTNPGFNASVSGILSANSGYPVLAVPPYLLSGITLGVAAFGYTEGYFTSLYEGMVDKRSLDAHAPPEYYDGVSDSVTEYLGELLESLGSRANKLHMMDLLVLLMYAEEEGLTDWHPVGPDIWRAYFDNPDVAFNAFAHENLATDEGLEVNKMMGRSIAYSVIDEGSRVFGDVGAPAMFDDGEELGYMVENGLLPRLLLTNAKEIAETLVQFAGTMAIQEVENNNYLDTWFPKEGVLFYGTDGTAKYQPQDAASADTFVINMSREMWNLDDSEHLGIDPEREIIFTGITGIIDGWFGNGADAPVIMDSAEITSAIDYLFSRPYYEAIESLQIKMPNASGDLELVDLNPTYDTFDERRTELFVGDEASDNIYDTWENNLIVARDGDDYIVAGLGADIIVGGEGSDSIIDLISVDIPEVANSQRFRDIYLGATERDPGQAVEPAYIEWVGAPDETDFVTYSVQLDKDDSGSIQGLGLDVLTLGMTDLDGHEAVALTISDQNTSNLSEDLLLGIEKVYLSERGDYIAVTPDMLKAEIWLEMAGHEGEAFGKADYDTVDYSGSGSGITLVNGAWSDNGENDPIDGFGKAARIFAEYIFDKPAEVKTQLDNYRVNAPLRITGQERTYLTDGDDVVWHTDFARIGGKPAGWLDDKNYQTYGEIWAGDGNDFLLISDVQYVNGGVPENEVYGLFEDEVQAEGAGEMRMEVFGEDGNDTIIVAGGMGADVVGGKGRDFLLNWSRGGRTWGDGKDGGGGSDDDTFWWGAGQFIMDAEKQDRLQMFGVPLTGGTDAFLSDNGEAYDWLLPFVRYGYTDGGQMIVHWGSISSSPDILGNATIVENFEFGTAEGDFVITPKDSAGTLGMNFRIYGEGDEVSLWEAWWGHLIQYLESLRIVIKSLNWEPLDDPLVLDLDGDGVETLKNSRYGIYFDMNLDGFRENVGWVGADDGFLVLDRNADGIINDVSEMFGAPGTSGFAELAAFDDHDDGVITADDAIFASLQVWRDLDGDGETDVGELFTLSELGIVSIDAVGDDTSFETPEGNTVRSSASFSYDDGRAHAIRELVFLTNQADTRYDGPSGRAEWTPDVDIKGYGRLTDLSIAMTNDPALADLVESVGSRMNAPDLELLMEQIQPVLALWSGTNVQSRELTPVLIENGVMVDRGIWVEDEAGGSWTLASGALLGAGALSLGDLLAQPGWSLIETWSPADREEAPAFRAALAYQTEVVDDLSTVLDWAEEIGGQWVTSGGETFATLEALLAEDGWKAESFAPRSDWADLPLDRMAVTFTDGTLTNYSVQVTDDNGSFHVWINNARRALEAEAASGDAGAFDLRNYELDLDALSDLDNTSDSHVYARIISPEQLRYAVKIYGADFQPEILTVDRDDAGFLTYPADIPDTLEFFTDLMETYNFQVRAQAVKLAAQYGLSEYFEPLDYNVVTDSYSPTGDRDLAPMFEAFFADAPAGRENAIAYLEGWAEILQVIYPDYNRGPGSSKTYDWVAQLLVAAHENQPTDAEFLALADIFGVEEESVILHESDATLVEGTGGDDIIVLTGGDQIYRGTFGSDVYVVGRDWGEDIIEDVEPTLSPRSPDYLRFAHLNQEDIFAYKDGLDLILEEIGTDNRLTIRDQFEGEWPGIFGGDYSPDTEMVQIVFADGSSWDELAIAYATSHPMPTNDLVLGTNAIDVLDGGAGNDILRGGRDSDVYIFGRGYGNDRIEDGNDNILLEHYDFVEFTEELRREDFEFERIGNSDDVTIYLLDETGARTDDSLLIQNQFKEINTILFGVHWLDRIERLIFESGFFMSDDDIMRFTVQDAKTDGEDAIWGFSFNDRLAGGKGDDLLIGGNLNDSYVFESGDGHDVIEDNQIDFLSGSYDVLELQGIQASDLTLERDGPSMTVDIVIGGDGDRVTLTNNFKLTSTGLFGDYYFDSVDEVRFSGGFWDFDTMARILLEGARTDGDDTIWGFDRNDLIDGGLGDDRLEGGVYSDTYVWGAGWGNDTIFDQSTEGLLAAGWDNIAFQGVEYDDVTFDRDGDDFFVDLGGERLTLEGQYKRGGSGQPTAIESFGFSDGEVLYTDLNPEDIDLVGTSGDDFLTGTDFGETIDGLAGDDTMLGRSDGDSYRFDVGYGNDLIIDRVANARWNGNDAILFGDDITTDNIQFSKEGDDLVISIVDRVDTLRVQGMFASYLNEIEDFIFADGTHWTVSDIEELLLIANGGRGDEILEGLNDRENILDGRQGDDHLIGGAFADTYLFGTGYGLDRITEVLNRNSVAGAIDKVVFGELITTDDVVVSREAGDVVFTIPVAGDQLRVTNGLSERLVEEYHFADNTVWTFEELRQAVLEGTDGADTLTGFDDTADRLDGGLGADELAGLDGDDVYVFGVGYGADGISEAGGNDRLEFGDLILPELLEVGADGDDLVLRFTGQEDSLVIRNSLGFGDAERRIETYAFEDGTEYTFDQIRQAVIDGQITDGDDVVIGAALRDDLVSGGEGADMLRGLSGADIYIITPGDGIDIIDDLGNSVGDRLIFDEISADDVMVRRVHPLRSDALIILPGKGDEVLIKGGLDEGNVSAIESIEFSDGTDWTIADLRNEALEGAASDGADLIAGFAQDEIIAGGAGDDTLAGGAGSDTYRFTRGDGRDLIDETNGAGDTDRLELIGYVPSDVIVSVAFAGRDDLLLRFADTDDEILIRGQYDVDAGQGVEEIVFGDGTVWTREEVAALVLEGGSEGADLLEGSGDANTLDGRGGDDTLSGGDGSDTYIYRLGDGFDRVEDNGSNDTDILRLVGIDPGDVLLDEAFGDRSSLSVSLNSAPGEVLLVNTLFGASGDQIEEIHFDDGTIWNVAAIHAALIAAEQSAGDDRVEGFNLADTLEGGTGTDWLSGKDGSDTYIVRPGDSFVTIEDQGARDTDVLRLDGFDLADASFTRAFGDDDTLEITLGADLVRVIDGLTSSSSNEIESYVFDDATLTSSDLRTRLLTDAQSPADDRITGFDGADTLNGGLGDDTLSGLSSSDLYLFAKGDGADLIHDIGFFSTDRLEISGYASGEAVFSAAPWNSANILITFPGFSDSIEIRGGISANSGIIEQIHFVDDDVTLSNSEIRVRLIEGSETALADYIRAFDNNDIIEAGPGNDYLIGSGGSDIYRFAPGDGQDFILENGLSAGDTIRITGYTPAQTSLELLPNFGWLELVFDGSDDRITAQDGVFGSNFDTIEAVEFDDGTIWSNADLKQMLLDIQLSTGGDIIRPFDLAEIIDALDGDDKVFGSAGADTITGGLGDDTLSGGTGSDHYLISTGDGTDEIQDAGSGSTDVIEFTDRLQGDLILQRALVDANTLEIRFVGSDDVLRVIDTLRNRNTDTIEEFHFSDGSVLSDDDLATLATETSFGADVDGTNSADTLTGTSDNERLSGARGDDIYVMDASGGRDIIEDGRGDDEVQLSGVAPAEITLWQRGNDLTLIWATGELALMDALATGTTGVDRVVFDNGTIWTKADMRAMVLAPSDGDDYRVGFGSDERFDAGLGHDWIIGGNGDDTYLYARGDGHDRIDEGNSFGGTADELHLTDILLSEVSFRRIGNDLKVEVSESSPGAGDAGSILLEFFLGTYFESGVETIRFADDTIRTAADLRTLVLGDAITDGADVIDGFSGDDTLSGGPGADLLRGGGGNDLYSWSRGDGDDWYDDQSTNGVDRLVLEGISESDVRLTHEGNDARLEILGADGATLMLEGNLANYFSAGINEIEFGATGTVWDRVDQIGVALAAQISEGNDVVTGFSTADIIEAGPGNDVINGDGSNDVFVWRRGDGNDILSDGNTGGGQDALRLIGIDTEDVSVFDLNGVDLRIVVADDQPGDGGEIILRESLNPFFSRGIETVEFDDGTIWTNAALRAELLATLNDDADRTIDGYSGADVIEGGPGRDLLRGDGGGDTYIWRHGDGDDQIEDPATSSGADRLRLIGVDPSAVMLRPAEGSDVVVIIGDSAPGADDGGRVLLAQSRDVYFNRGIQFIEFDDGTEWQQVDFFAMALKGAATEGPNVLTGSSGADLLEGLGGDDRASGLAGDDTYRFARGDGSDQIDEGGAAADVDLLEITGYAEDEVAFARLGTNSDDLVIRMADGDRIVVLNGLGAANDAIERFVFPDTGTELSLDDIRARLIADLATEGDDLVIGTVADEVLTGRGGADILDGEGGADTYKYGAGDGDDRVDDTSLSAGDSLILLDYGVADLTDLRRSPPDGLDLILTFADGDRVTVVETLGTDNRGIEVIRFADGTEWTMPGLRADLLAEAGTDGDDRIWGFATDDEIRMGPGSDRAFGGLGGDTYIFALGDGADLIADNGSTSGTDRVEITGYASTEVTVQRYYKGDDGIVLSFAGDNGDKLTILNTLDGGADGIEEIAFNDDVVWGMAEVAALLDNSAPVAAQDGYFTAVQGAERTLLPADLLTNDFDPDGDPLSILSVSGAIGGDVRLEGGAVIFTPFEDTLGPAAFDYTITDGANGLDTATALIRVRPPAFAADDDGLEVDEDSFLQIDAARLLANDFDGDLLDLAQVIQGSGGVASLSTTGFVTFTPDQNFTGTASFRYVANTPDGGRAEADVFVDVLPVNDAPIARDNFGFSVDEGGTLFVPFTVLLANDVDIDGDNLTVTTAYGTVTAQAEMVDGGILVTPDADFFGNLLLSYQIDDGAGGTDIADFRVTVNPVNSAPRLGNDVLETNEDTPLFFSVDELLANDVEPDGAPMEVVGLGRSFGGQVRLYPNDTILFTPWDDFEGLANFSYDVSDGQGGLSTATVIVEVAPINDFPRARSEDYQEEEMAVLNGLEDTPIALTPATLLANDSDVDSTSLTLETVSSAVNGQVEINADGNIVFTPDPDYWGEASFRYVISDGDGGVDDARVTMYFSPTSDAPPVATDDTFQMFEDVTQVIRLEDILANDFDIDLDPLEIIDIRPVNGIVARKLDLFYDFDGNLVVAPKADVNGDLLLSYTISDGADGIDTGLITLEIAPVNDLPIPGADSLAGYRGMPVVVRISDLLANDDDPADFEELANAQAQLSFAGAITASSGALEVYDDEFVILRNADGFSGTVSFDYTLEDGDGGQAVGRVSGAVDAAIIDTLTGSGIRDLLIGSLRGETIEGLAGEDDLFGEGGDDTLEGGDDADRLDGGTGFDFVSYASSNIGVRADLGALIGQGGHAQGDQYVSVEGVIGSDFADQLFTLAAGGELRGGGGDDALEGDAAADTLKGDTGDDTLTGLGGGDVLHGGEGSDWADYTGSDAITISLIDGTASGGDAVGDVLISIENILGTDEADAITGDDAANVLRGGRADDTLSGEDGDDRLDGGRGADALDGGAGTDLADYRTSLSGVAVNLADESAGGGNAAGDRFTSIEGILGSFHDDTITGDAGDNLLIGGLGADVIDGNGGFDTVDYTDSAEAISIDLGAATQLGGDAEGDALTAISAIIASPYDDTLTGDAGGQQFDGGFGDDLLRGEAGSDTYLMYFDSGNDLVEEMGAAGDTDTVLMGADVETSDLGLIRMEDGALLLELEHDDGFLIDRMVIADHFAGPETGIEEIVFDDGTIWDRADIDALARDDAFNARDDRIRFGQEDQEITIEIADLIANDTSSGDPAITITSVSNPVGGTVTLNGDGTITFTGDLNFNGDAFFDYTATDGQRISDATVEIEVQPVNDAPVATPDGVYEVDEDGFVTIPIAELLGNDSDIDGDSLQLNGSFFPTQELVDFYGVEFGAQIPGGFGKLREADGTEIIGVESLLENGTNGQAFVDLFRPNVIFAPTGNYFGSAGFSYTVSDGNGGGAVANVEIIVNAVNDAPNTSVDSFSTRKGQTVGIDVEDLLRNDTDVEGDDLVFVSVQDAKNGSLTLSNLEGGSAFGAAPAGLDDVATGDILFTPDADFLGEAEFTYTVADSRGAETTQTVKVMVIPLNDPPRAGNDRFTAEEDTPLFIPTQDLLRNDFDGNGDPLSITGLDLFPEKGDVLRVENGVLFTPDENYNGDASFFYSISDGRGGSARGEVFIEILPDNDDPFVTDDTQDFETEEDTPLLLTAFELFANDGDPDGDVLYFKEFSASDGSLVLDGENLLFTPADDFVGAAVVRYKAQDLKGGVSETFASLTVNVLPAADVVDARDDTISGLQGVPLVFPVSALLANDRDADGDPISFDGFQFDGPGSLVLEDGDFTYTGDPDFWGDVVFTYDASDVDGIDTASVTLDIAPDNEAPIVGADTAAGDEDTPVIIDFATLLANDSDPDGDPLTISGFEARVENGRVTRLPGDRLSFIAEVDFVGDVDFTYEVTDGITDPVIGTVTVSYAAVNDAPVPVDDFGFETQVGNDLLIDIATLLENDGDVEGDALSLVSIGTFLNGSAVIEGDAIRFTPDVDAAGPAAFTYTVTDGALTGEAQVSIAVGTLTAREDFFFGVEDQVLELNPGQLSENDDASGGGALTITRVYDPVGGTVAFGASGEILFTPEADHFGVASFLYEVTDEIGRSADGAVTLTFAAADDAPEIGTEIADWTIAAGSEESFEIDGSAFTDADGDFLTIAASLPGGADLPNWLTFDPFNTLFTATPDEALDGSYVIDVTATDALSSVTQSFLLTVENQQGITSYGSASDDALEGTERNDLLDGLDGDDLIRPGMGVDRVSTGSGEDTVEGGAAELDGDAITDFNAEDTVVLKDTVLDPEGTTVTEGSAIFAFDTDGDGTPDAEITLEGEFADSVFELTEAGSDTVIRLAGENATRLTDSDERFITLDAGANLVMGGAGNDFLLTAAGADTLDGGAGSDVLVAGVDGDMLIGGSGNDILNGGAGADVFVFRTSDFTDFGIDTIENFAPGQDRILLDGFSHADVTDFNGDALIDTGLGGFIQLEGVASADLLAGDIETGDAPMRSLASIGAVHALSDTEDRLITSDPGENHVIAGDGDDVVLTGGGSDYLEGGAGSDLLIGGAGDDRIDGGTGNDILTGGAGADVFVFSTDEAGFIVDTITDFDLAIDQIWLSDTEALPAVLNLNGSAALEVGTLQFVVLEGVSTPELETQLETVLNLI